MSTKSNKITVVIIDDHDWVRFAIKTSLENEQISCVGEGKNVTEALELCKELHPDALVLDMLMAGGNGWKYIPEIQEVSPQTKIIAISAFADAQMVENALQNGAASFFSKSDSISELRDAILTVN